MFEGKFLSFLSMVGGVPVRKTKDGVIVVWRQEKFGTWRILLINFFGCFLCPAWYIAMSFLGIKSVSDWTSTFFDRGMTKTDVVCLLGNSLLPTLALVVFILSFRRNNVQISEIHQRILSRQYLVPEEDKTKARKQSSILLLIDFVLAITTCFAIGFTTQFGIFSDAPGSVPAVITTAMTSGWSLLLYSGPLIISMNWVSCNIMELCGSNLKFWRLTLAQENVAVIERLEKKMGKVSPQSFIGHGLDRGFELLEDLKAVNGCMGLPILIELITSLVSVVASSLFLSSFYTILSADEKIFYYILILLANLGILSYSLIRAVKLALAGEAILTQLQAGKEALQELKITKEPTLTDLDARKLDVLIDRFGSHPGIRPRNYFTVGKSASFSSFGLIITYYIVLLQFKFSE